MHEVYTTLASFRPPLISKGLRQTTDGLFMNPCSFRPPLISKGLRRFYLSEVPLVEGFQATPDFKGIKTY